MKYLILTWSRFNLLCLLRCVSRVKAASRNEFLHLIIELVAIENFKYMYYLHEKIESLLGFGLIESFELGIAQGLQVIIRLWPISNVLLEQQDIKAGDGKFKVDLVGCGVTESLVGAHLI